jgi:KaiC/GvpD/RAD55 family RecA-like ATPase/transcriptional regulator with XRE-family HTH domain
MPSIAAKTLPDLLRTRLRDGGIKQRELAERLGKDATTISAWIRGKQLPRPDDQETVSRLAALFDLNPEDVRRLLSGQDRSSTVQRSIRSAEGLQASLDGIPGFLDRILPPNTWRSARSIREALQELHIEVSESTVATYLKTFWANGVDRLWIDATGLAHHLFLPRAIISVPTDAGPEASLAWLKYQFRDQEWARQAVRIASRRLNLRFASGPDPVLSRTLALEEITAAVKGSFPSEVDSDQYFHPFGEAMLAGFQALHQLEESPSGIVQRWQLSASMLVNSLFGVDPGGPQLRFLFDGGLLARVHGGVIASVYGAPGSCKTTLAVQIAAAFASAGEISLYLAADETMESFMDRLSFLGYQPRSVGCDYPKFAVSRVSEQFCLHPLDLWDDLDQHLPKDWPQGASGPSTGHLFLVQIPNRRDFLANRGQFIHNLNWLLARVDPQEVKLCGTFLDSVDAVVKGAERSTYEDLFRFSRKARAVGFFISETSNPEALKLRSHLADIVIKMGFRTRVGSFKERVIEIEKCRSQSHIRGEHMLAVHHSDGLVVYPSVQSLLSVWRRRIRTHHTPQTVSWTIPGLNLMSELGLDLQRGEPILLCGPRSTLKLPLALGFLLSEGQGADSGSTLLVSLRDDEASILHSTEWFPELHSLLNDRQRSGWFSVAHFPPDYVTAERFIHWVQRRLRQAKVSGRPVTRVVFSNLGQLDSNSPALKEEPLFIPALIELFRRKRISSLFLADGASKSSRDWFATVVSTSHDERGTVWMRVAANSGTRSVRRVALAVAAGADGCTVITSAGKQLPPGS